MNGAGVGDNLIGYRRRPFGSGLAARQDPLGLPDADRDALVESGDAPPHPVGPDERTPNRSAERIELVGFLGPIQGVHRNDHHVRENAHRGDGRGHADRRGRGPITQGDQDLRPHPGEHEKPENDDADGARDDEDPGEPVQAARGNPARVVLVGTQAVTGEGETAVGDDGDHRRQGDRERQLW